MNMKKYFKAEETNRLFRVWLNMFPDVEHPCDRERFYEFLLSLFESGEELTDDILIAAIHETKQWGEDYIEEFSDKISGRYFLIKGFWDFAIEKNKIALIK